MKGCREAGHSRSSNVELVVVGLGAGILLASMVMSGTAAAGGGTRGRTGSGVMTGAGGGVGAL